MLDIVGDIPPFNEFLIRNGVGTSGIVFDKRPFFRCGIYIEVNSSGSAFNQAVSSTVDCSVECIITVVMEIISQQILCLNVKIIGQVCQLIMMNGSFHNT